MTTELRVLIIEDDEGDALLLVEELRAGGYDPTFRRVETQPELAQALAETAWDIIVSDFRMPHFSGIDALALYRELDLDIPFILVSGTVGDATAVMVMKAGAHDFVMKEHLAMLVPAIDRELRDAEERRRRRQAEADLRASETRLRAIVDTAPDGILTLDEQGVVTSANPAAERLFGYTADRLVGINADQIIPGLFQRMMLPPGSHAVKVPNPVIGGYGSRADGTRFPLELTYGEMHLQGRQFTCVIHDLTRRRQTDERIARSFNQLSALRRIDMAISGSLNLRLILEIVLDEACRHLAVDAASVLLLDPATYTLTYYTGHGFQSKLIRQTVLRLGEGMAGQVAFSRQTLSVPDRRQYTGTIMRTELFDQEGFVFYHGVPLVAKGQIKGVLEIFHRAPLQPDADWQGFAEALAGQAAIAIDNTALFEDLQHTNAELVLAYDDTIEGWSRALDLRDKETEGHSRRVTEMTLILARAMGMSEVDLAHIRRGALLHDIGKMGIPDSILLKPGPLTEEEWEIMRRHPVYAFEMLSPIKYLRPALHIPYCHHEKWDGSGYPRGLMAEQIPLEARIFAMIDVWDALTSARPYRGAWSRERTLAHISAAVGSHFDPEVLVGFLRVLGEDAPPTTH